MRRVLRRAALLSIALVVVVTAHAPILRGLAAAMTVDRPLVHADLIMPLYQDPAAVPRAVAALFRDGYAERIALYDPPPTRLEEVGLQPRKPQLWRALLVAEGVPDTAISVVGASLADDGALPTALVGLVGPRRPVRIIVVSSRSSSRIAWIDIRRAFKGFPVEARMRAVPASGFEEREWWHSRAGAIAYFDAWCLWLLRWVR